MTIDQLINLLVTVTLIEMMLAIGLHVTLPELLGVARNWRLLGRAALASYVCVPAATVGLLLLWSPPPLVAVGLLILAACPGAPYGPPFAAIAGGSVPVATGLMVLLAGSSAVLAPLLLWALLPLVTGSGAVDVGATRIVATLLATQLLPLCAGLALRHARPNLAERLQRPADAAGKVLNLVAVGLILVAQFRSLLDIRLLGFLGMFLLLAASWSAGWLFGGRQADIRRTMTLTTSLRNVSVGLVIATSGFAGTAAVTAVAAYGLVALFGTLALALVLGSFLPSASTLGAGRIPGAGNGAGRMRRSTP